jgi:hypothetical protein
MYKEQMSRIEFYGSEFHFRTEMDYETYLELYKKKR